MPSENCGHLISQEQYRNQNGRRYKRICFCI